MLSQNYFAIATSSKLITGIVTEPHKRPEGIMYIYILLKDIYVTANVKNLVVCIFSGYYA